MDAALPTEIWLHISNHIPNETLRDFYSLNRIFFDIAMDLRYRRFELSALTYRRLQGNKCLGRVRELVFHPASFASGFHFPVNQKRESSLAKLGSALGSLIGRAAVSNRDLDGKGIITLVPSFNNVKSLSIIWSKEDDPSESRVRGCLPLFKAICTTISSTTHSLYFDVFPATRASYGLILDCIMINIPALSSISLASFSLDSTWDPEGRSVAAPDSAFTDLNTFLDRYTRTLYSLKVHHIALGGETKSLLNNLCLPNLRHISLPLLGNTTVLMDSSYNMIKRHSELDLTSVELCFPPDIIYQQLERFLCIPFPRLTSIKLITLAHTDTPNLGLERIRDSNSITIPSYPYPGPSRLESTLIFSWTRSFSERYLSTLQTLVIHIPLGLPMVMAVIRDIVPPHAEQGTASSLTHLEVHFDLILGSVLDPHVGAEMAKDLIASLGRFFDLMDGPLSNVETLGIIVLLGPRAEGLRDMPRWQRVDSAKMVLRSGLMNHSSISHSTLKNLSFSAQKVDDVCWRPRKEYGFSQLARLEPLFPSLHDDIQTREIDLRTIQARFPAIEIVNWKPFTHWTDWWC